MTSACHCSYCGQPITDACLTFKGRIYHAIHGINSEGKLIYVDRDASCFELSEMGTKSLVGEYAPPIYAHNPNSYPN